MKEQQYYVFPPFSLHSDGRRLYREQQPVPLRPQDFIVLHYLVSHPERILSKEELLQACWPTPQISPTAVKVCIREIRQALQDDAKAPRFIETVPRRGYRFIAPLTINSSPISGFKLQAPNSEIQRSILVGREAELTRLQNCLEKARRGQRQVVFVTGEPGIGKSTLVDAFLQQRREEENPYVARGQCVEHYGSSEAYQPVLAALDRLCRTSEGAPFLAALRREAPMWLLQLTLPLEATERADLQQQLQGTTPSRMLREMAAFIPTVTAERPLILVIEDMHWCDHATVTLLSYLAQQQEPAQVLIISTYRSAEMIAHEHPLRAMHQDLSARGCCEDITLAGLGVNEIEEYLHFRFPHSALPMHVARTIYQRTEGNPLFMVAMVDELVARGMLAADENETPAELTAGESTGEAPHRLRQLITRHIEQCSATDRRLLEAASVAGVEFSVVEVAAMLATDTVEVEERCEEFARQQRMLRPAGFSEWPDGTPASRYRFHHALYQALWQERVKAGRWQRWHQRMGERKEAGYGERTSDIAAELAIHFAQGRDYARAVKYHLLAGNIALQRYGHHEAIDHFTQSIALLKHLPETPERDQQELQLQMTLGAPLVMMKGPTAPEAETVYSRARELCQHLEATPQLVPAYLGLVKYYAIRGNLQIANKLGSELLTLAQQLQDALLLPIAYAAWGSIRFLLGDLAIAYAQGEQAVRRYDVQKHGPLIFLHGENPGIMGLTVQLSALWHLGYPDQALRKGRKAYLFTQATPHPFNIAHAQMFMAWLHHLRGEIPETQQWVDALIAFSTKEEVPFWLAPGLVIRGWALTEQGAWDEGIALMRQGVEQLQALGAEIWWTVYQALLSGVYIKAKQFDKAQRCLDEALEKAQEIGEFFYSAELYRLKGELLLARELQDPSPS